MKKIILLILLFMMFTPFIVKAKECCKVVSGNGKDIGSEIACGTEHFYVVDSSNDEIKMLAKYNLNIGKIIYKEKIEKDENDTRSDEEYCQDLAASNGGTVKSDGFYNDPGYCFYDVDSVKGRNNVIYVPNDINTLDSAKQYCQNEIAKKESAYFSSISPFTSPTTFVCTYIELEKQLKQDEEAKSAHWDEDLKYLYPQVGDVYIEPGIRADDGVKNYQLHENPVQENTNFYDYDMMFSTYSGRELYHDPYTILQIYKNELERTQYTIKEINMLSVSELNRIINKISQKSLPLKEWGDNLEIVQGQYENNGTIYGTEIHFGDLKPYIPNNYKWLYSTTYWNSTAYKLAYNPSNGTPKEYYVFTAEQGKLCGAGFAFCANETALGCGIRPVITIPNELQYLIKTETDGNGKIDVVENSLGGETIQFKVSANKDYKLKSVVIKTDSGEEVEFTEGEITENDDGTISIDKNKFTMPYENVTIEARWIQDIVNPYTGNKLLIVVLLISIILGIGTFIYKRKEANNKA